MAKLEYDLPKNFKVASDGFDMHFLVWFLHDEESKKFKQHVSQEGLRLNSEDISYRIINHWEKEGLLEDNRDNGKGWRKYSISDILWIQVINELRKFGLTIEDIRKVKAYLESAKDLNHKISKRPLFDYYLLHSMAKDDPTYLLVFSDGDSLLFTKHELEVAKALNTIEGSHITVDLFHLIKKAFKKRLGGFGPYVSPLPLSEEQKLVLEHLKDESLKSITIQLDKGTVVMLEGEFDEDTNVRLSELLKAAPFQEIQIKQHKGKITSVKRKVKSQPKQ